MTSTQAPELKPCPFCGEVPLAHGVDGSDMISVWCTCGARGPDRGYDVWNASEIFPLVYADWNTRADNSQTLVGAAYEDAAKTIDENKGLGPNENWHLEFAAGYEAGQMDVELQLAERIRALTPTNAQDALSTLIAEAERRGAEREREACAELAYNSDPEAPAPPAPYDDWGDMISDTSERHAACTLDYKNWCLAQAIRNREQDDE